MSIRPVKRVIKSKPTLEGAGVHLRRAFGFGNTSDFDPFLLLPGILTAASTPSPMCSLELWNMATVWGTGVPSLRVTCNG
jgi:redox-sensitive bicupin YhaK (pirin superfamily)